MSEYIKREAAIYACLDGWDNDAHDCVENLRLIPAAEVLEIRGLNEKGRKLLAYCPDAVNTLAAYLEEVMDQTALYGPKGSARPEPFNVEDFVVVHDGPSRTPAPTEDPNVPRPCPFCGIRLERQELASVRAGRHLYPVGDPYYYHPDNGCILAGADILEHQLPAWNKRT